METLQNHFSNRQDLRKFVKELAPWAKGDCSSIIGGKKHATELLEQINPVNYARSRNFGNGKITRLSPYITHGIINLNDVRNFALSKCFKPEQITKFIQELAWRDFWQRIAANHPEWIWRDVESYKTGFTPDDYADALPDDISSGNTGVACLDAFINDLTNIGYVHNHARMYLASYIVHFRRIKWQVGARWFLEHLLDGDEASNNFSWQWVASTFSNRPYIFNLENVHKYFGDLIDTSPENNTELNKSYQELSADLFPNFGRSNG